MTAYVYAALMGFVMAAPFGAVGVACAMAAMQYRGREAAQLAAGVLLADAVVIGVVNMVLRLVPGLVWEDVQGWRLVWWMMTGVLAAAGLVMLLRPMRMVVAVTLRPEQRVLLGLGWTLLANPKNWLGMFAAYLGWRMAGLLDTTGEQVAVGVCAWLGAAVAWGMWIALCWQAQAWRVQAEQLAVRLMGIVCVMGAGVAAWMLLG